MLGHPKVVYESNILGWREYYISNLNLALDIVIELRTLIFNNKKRESVNFIALKY